MYGFLQENNLVLFEGNDYSVLQEYKDVIFHPLIL